MAKILPDGRIQIELGDTLSAIYGSNWKELSGYTGDPTKLQPGTILPAKPAGSLGGSLTGETEKTLPVPTLDKLSMFQDVLRLVTQKAGQEAKVAGATALPEGMLKPEQVSGGTFADILNMVSQQKTRGISEIYKTTVELLDRQQQEADSHLTMLINTGAIANLDDDTLTKLAESTHTPIDYLKEVRKVKKESAVEEGLSIEDAATYADMVLTGQLDLTSVPSGEGMRAEVGRMLSQVYQNPIANRIEVWKGKKEKFLEEGEESGYADPGTREDLIREIKNALQDYSVDEIKEMVYALVPDVWEFNVQRRWRAKAGVTIINE